MHFSRLQISNFGPVGLFDADLAPSGVHIVAGPNGAGKTHVLAALLHSVLGAGAELAARREGATADTEIRVVLASGARDEEAYTYARATDSPAATLEPTYRTLGSVPMPPSLFNDLRSFVGNPELPRLVLDPETSGAAEYAAGVPDGVFDDLPVAGPAVTTWKRILSVLARLAPSDWSAGEHALLDVAVEYARRRDCPIAIPLVLDAPFGRLDHAAHELAQAMLSAIAMRSQVILIQGADRGGLSNSGEARVWNLDRSTVAQSVLGLRSSVYGQFTRVASSAGELGYLRRVSEKTAANKRTGVSDSNALAASVERLAMMQQSLMTTVQSNHNEQLALSNIIHGLCVDTNGRVRDIQTSMSELLARSALTMEAFREHLEAAVERVDAHEIDSICNEISQKVVRQVRHELRGAELEKIFDVLRSEVGCDWEVLDSISQRDIALSRWLRESAGLDANHLAILQTCRAVEHEILRNVFAPFRELVQANPRADWWGDSAVRERSQRSYKMLYEYAVAGTGRLTLGQFGWVVKTAKQEPSVPLFQALTAYLAERYADRFEDVTARLIRISIGPLSELDSAAPAIPFCDVRNACAHPPSLSGDHAATTGEASFRAVWRFAVLEPVELALLLARRVGGRN